ncbi:Spermatogenesis-associated serine-rich protein 2 [Bagarius yarrelli]|uniref:Spermatogenesis-associated serine-rich protein 2 n=1 Tax=Bagarius yarrelli TaxID=175774 RepID=A0A556U7Q5_BAGYA|nr:Spermatogenesis-associated serine-rich protein 2 [Bagarius yarrelli]
MQIRHQKALRECHNYGISNPNDTSGVEFDTHSKMVMSQGGTFEKMKEKINAVRAVVPNKSNNEIALVLQHFENSVDRAVQAFVEGSAVEILKEWNVTGKKKPKKKKKPKPQPEAPVDPAPESVSSVCSGVVNGFHANGSADGESLDSLSEQLDSVSLDAAELELEPATPELSMTSREAETQKSLAPASSPSPQQTTNNAARQNQHSSRGNKSRLRPPAGSHNAPFLPPDDGQGSSAAKKIAPNIDRSVKDLQRCTASLTRYRVVVKEEMDSSIKRMKQTFAELQSCLMDREVALLAEMDKVKAEAMYHPQTGYSNRSRCSSTSSSVAGSVPVEATAPPQAQPQASGYTNRSNVPHKQVFQGNRRIFQGYPGQRHNGSSYYDRNSNRNNYRYSGDQRHQGDRSQGNPSNSQFSNSMKDPAHPSVPFHQQDCPAQNGLPQRQPRTTPKNP